MGDCNTFRVSRRTLNGIPSLDCGASCGPLYTCVGDHEGALRRYIADMMHGTVSVHMTFLVTDIYNNTSKLLEVTPQKFVIAEVEA
jgi:hypothetical protein